MCWTWIRSACSSELARNYHQGFGTMIGTGMNDSTKIAKMLYNDARRLLLEHYLCEVDHSFLDLTSFAKSFILLEIYGICSGDKRAYEFIEFFHGNKMLTIARCIDALAANSRKFWSQPTRFAPTGSWRKWRSPAPRRRVRRVR